MDDDDKELTKDELKSLFPADFIDSLGCAEGELDAQTLAMLAELDAIGSSYSDETVSVRPISELPTPAIATAAPEVSLEVAIDPAPIGPIMPVAGIAVRHLFRRTKRKAGKYRPNCFGSQYLHDPESAVCRPCIYSEGCKKTIVAEIPRIKAQGTAHTAPFKRSSNPAQLKSLAISMRAGHLRAFWKSREKRLEKDRINHRVKREKASAEIRIHREAKKHFAALRSATAKPGKDKRLEQLRGRETMIMAVWAAGEHARLIHGPGASDAQVAKSFERMGGGHITRHQARSHRLLFKRLDDILKMTAPKTLGGKTA